MAARLWCGFAVLALSACTSVKMVQREGCWVKQTDHTIGGSSEELGFCARQQPVWAQDRMARLVQECMAQADYRWENRAIAAWGRAQPIPPPENDETVAKTCMSQVSAALGIETENQALKARVAELQKERDTLRGEAQSEQRFLHQSNGEMVSALGEAAKKPAPSALAFSTSEGKATSDPGQAAGTTVVGLTSPGPTTQVFLPQNQQQPAAAVKADPACAGRRLNARGTRDDKDKAACTPPALPELKPAAAAPLTSR